MSNNYCLKASGKQIVELARLMDAHSRRTGFDEPILYLGDACRLEPIPYSKVYATCDTPRIFSACLVEACRVPDVGAGTYERAFLQQLRS